MQSKKQIQQLLAYAGVQPQRGLGQHFLVDLNLLRLIVNSAQITERDLVLEVGCGTGSLTEGLAESAGRVIAVEYDPVLANIATEQLKDAINTQVLNCDILDNKRSFGTQVTDALNSARKQYRGRFLLVANLPYKVASPVIINMVAGAFVADEMYVTVQKEVAQRMTAQPDTAEYGHMGILLAATGRTRIARILKPTVFWPQPQVDSALVEFVRDKDKSARIKDFQLLIAVVNLFMGHRRKTIKACTRLAEGSLAGIDNWLDILANCGIDPAKRPEQLTPQQYVDVANHCSAQ